MSFVITMREGKEAIEQVDEDKREAYAESILFYSGMSLYGSPQFTRHMEDAKTWKTERGAAKFVATKLFYGEYVIREVEHDHKGKPYRYKKHWL